MFVVYDVWKNVFVVIYVWLCFLVVACVCSCKGIVVVDEQTPSGNLSACVFEGFSSQNYFPKIISKSLPEKYVFENGGRNYLLKKGKALRFNKENQELVNKRKDELNKKNLEVKNKFKEIAKLVNNKKFLFNKESKENGELYGSIKPKEITNLIREKVKAEVSPSQIILKDELNKIGVFKAEINFHSEVKANISIQIDKIQSK